MIIISDIDGVLLDISKRLHFLREKNYDSFYCREAMEKDEIIAGGLEFLRMLRYYSDYFIFCTGRPERTREITELVLSELGFDNCPVFMRKDHDFRKSHDIKPQMIKKILDDFVKSRNDTIFFVDDDPRNVNSVTTKIPEITGIVFGDNFLSR